MWEALVLAGNSVKFCDAVDKEKREFYISVRYGTGNIGAEAFIGIFHPGEAVQPFPYSESDGRSTASAMGALIHYKGILPRLPRQLVATAEIPQGGSTVTVKLDLKQRSVPDMIVPGCQLCSILGGDGHGFMSVLLSVIKPLLVS